MPITGLSEALRYYRVCVEAEGYSPKTISATSEAVRYFSKYLGEDVALPLVGVDHLRGFILALRRAKAYRNHPKTPVQDRGLSPQHRGLCQAHKGLLLLLREGGAH